jgi:hypothetical protein
MVEIIEYKWMELLAIGGGGWEEERDCVWRFVSTAVGVLAL